MQHTEQFVRAYAAQEQRGWWCRLLLQTPQAACAFWKAQVRVMAEKWLRDYLEMYHLRPKSTLNLWRKIHYLRVQSLEEMRLAQPTS